MRTPADNPYAAPVAEARALDPEVPGWSAVPRRLLDAVYCGLGVRAVAAFWLIAHDGPLAPLWFPVATALLFLPIGSVLAFGGCWNATLDWCWRRWTAMVVGAVLVLGLWMVGNILLAATDGYRFLVRAGVPRRWGEGLGPYVPVLPLVGAVLGSLLVRRDHER